MKISELMTRNVRSCRKGDTLSQAAQLMWDHDCGCVPVVGGDGKVLGMLTDRDICMAAQFSGKPLDALKVEDSMSKHLFSCAPGDTIDEVEAIMREQQIRRLPVIDGGELVGIVSMNDLVRAATSKKLHRAVRPDGVDATLAAICQPRIHDSKSIPGPLI